MLFDTNVPISPGLFALPSTGPAYAFRGGPSARFFFEGSGNKVGTAFFVSHLEPDLSTVRFARYARHLASAYQLANAAVDAILDAVGSTSSGEPLRDVFVVSDHGMAPFHTTAVNLRNLLIAGGFEVNQLGLSTSGAAANIYVNLQGRQSRYIRAQLLYGAHGRLHPPVDERDPVRGGPHREARPQGGRGPQHRHRSDSAGDPRYCARCHRGRHGPEQDARASSLSRSPRAISRSALRPTRWAQRARKDSATTPSSRACIRARSSGC